MEPLSKRTHILLSGTRSEESNEELKWRKKSNSTCRNPRATINGCILGPPIDMKHTGYRFL